MAKRPVPWLGKQVGNDHVLARLDEIDAKLERILSFLTANESLEDTLATLKAADETLDRIEPAAPKSGDQK